MLHKFQDRCEIAIYQIKSFTLWFCTILIWFMPIFMSQMPESGFLSGSPVFQKLHIWNLHVMGSFWMQKFSRTNFVRGPVLPRIEHFQTFFLIWYICPSKMIRNLGFLCPGFFPDAAIRILGELSGFWKSIYLDSTCYEKFRPGSGFALNWSFLDIFLLFLDCYRVL